MASANGHDPSQVAVAAGMGELTVLLAALLAEARSEVLEVAVSDAYGRELTLEHAPVVGVKRVLAHRTGNGFDNFQAPLAPGALFVPANEGRLGLRVANAGANACNLYLSDAQRQGVPVVPLAAGAFWDGRFGNLLWCGNVWAVALVGVTTLIGGEL